MIYNNRKTKGCLNMTLQEMNWYEPYVGKRDIPLEIVVPQSLCHAFIDNNGRNWVEIEIPPRDLRMLDTVWSTIVVEPAHVYYVDNEPYNMFWVNAGAMLNLYYKERSIQSDTRSIVSAEQDTSEQILVRILQWEAYRNGRVTSNRSNILKAIETDYLQSGLTMMNFIRTLR